MVMAIITMPLTSCEKEPQKQQDPKSDEDQRKTSGYDEYD